MIRIVWASTLILACVVAGCSPAYCKTSNKPAPVFGMNLQRAIVMKEIPAGTFSMGETGIAEPVHQVTLSAFKMQETPVTQEQYLAVMKKNPSYFNLGAKALLRPVENVSWYDAVQFCNSLSKLSGLDPCYTFTDTVDAGNNYIVAANVVFDATKNGYRLPTEAQWEYACRAGAKTTYWWGADTSGMGARTWFADNTGGAGTQPVATKLANAYGLYDMMGNVWEWCDDWYGAYTTAATTDPTGPATGTYRVQRGGSWGSNAHVGFFRCADRLINYPLVRDDYGGFRVVLP